MAVISSTGATVIPGARPRPIKQPAIPPVSVVDATVGADGTTAATLANANKAKINAIITALQAAGILS